MATKDEAMRMALDALEIEHSAIYGTDKTVLAIEALRTALAQPEPVNSAVIAGALFDFMGWLTSRKTRIVLSSADDASPAVDVIREFSEMRNLSLDNAQVHGWENSIVATSQSNPMSNEDISKMYLKHLQNLKVAQPDVQIGITYEEANPPQPHCQRCGKKLGTEVTDIHTCTPIRKEWVGLTDEEIEDIWGEPLDLMYSGNFEAIKNIEAKLKEKNSD